VTPYTEFVASKVRRQRPAGFDASRLPSCLKPFQREIVKWACQTGRAAVFLGTGLGKTLIQLAWADQVAKKTGGKILIVCPLAVGPQTVREADKFGIRGVARCESQDNVTAAVRIAVTNYQRLHLFDAGKFAAVVIDESGILKNFTGKVKRDLCERFARHEYKLACTATPAPNDCMELGNHADFLGVMPANEMLSRWFINDQAHAGEYRLKKHAEKDYWRWVSSWACAARHPRDLGHDEPGYDLPPLEYREHVVNVDVTADAGGALLRSDRLTATTLHQEMRRTAPDRAAKVAEIIAAEPPGPWLIWCNTDYEADALKKLLPDAAEVRGSDTDKAKEDRLIGFADGRIQTLITKPGVAGWGLNWQHCDRMAFVGLSYSFEQQYQAVRRCWRFGQPKPVIAHFVMANTEGEVLAVVKKKAAEHERMHAAMAEAVREFWGRTDGRRSETTPHPETMKLPKWLTTHTDNYGGAA